MSADDPYTYSRFFEYDQATNKLSFSFQVRGAIADGSRATIQFDNNNDDPVDRSVTADGHVQTLSVDFVPEIPVHETARGSFDFAVSNDQGELTSESRERFSIVIETFDTGDVTLTSSVSDDDNFLWFNAGDQSTDMRVGNDIGYMGAGNDRVLGNDGVDYIDGGADADTLDGGTGDDRLVGGSGGDFLSGGSGVDVLDYQDSAKGVRVNLLHGTATGGDAQGDVISGFERLLGSRHTDALSGDAQANVIHGYGGNDSLYGGSRDDLLYGGVGNDRIEGQRGADRLYGEAGADFFVFRDPRDSAYFSPGRDVIEDFSHAEGDKIHLTLMDADVTQAGDQNFAFVGYALFTGHAGELRVNNSRILGDLDGDGQADFSIEIAGARFLTADDFAL